MRRNEADVLTHGDSNAVFLADYFGVRGLWLVGRHREVGAHNFRMREGC